MVENEMPQSGPRAIEEYLEMARIMRSNLAGMEDAVAEYERALRSIFQRARPKHLEYWARVLGDSVAPH